MPFDYHMQKLTGRHRFRDVSNMKLMDILKSLRRRRLRRDVSQRSSLTHSRSIPLSPADHASPVQPSLRDLFASSSICYRTDAASILSVTEADCSSGTSTSSSGLGGTPPGVERGCHFSPRTVPAFPTSPSVFQLRSTSREDHLVDRLEQHLRQLSLDDASPDQTAAPKNSSSRDIPMDVCLDVPLPRFVDPDACTLSDDDSQKPVSSPHNQNVVPMIVITSVDAKHAKPLPPSSHRPSKTPFSPSNVINRPTDTHPTKSKSKTPPDDPFTAQPHGSAYPPNYNLTFRLPSLLSAYPPPSKYAPETPTPMYCDHLGDCRGDLWEVLHPPLVAGRFTLPPFKLPPLSTGLFDDMSMPLPY